MTFTTKIDPSLAPRLKKDLEEQGFSFAKPPYTIFSAKKKGVSCTLYESGSLTVQGKEMKEFIEFYLEPNILQTFEYSHPAAHVDMEARIGMDEAGKGDFFGPLVVAAVYADGEKIKKLIEIGVKDSKRFTDDKIKKMAKKIKAEFNFTIIRFFPKKYNELYQKFKNLNRFLAWAHTAALADLSQKSGCKKALLDQFANPALMLQMLKQKKIEFDLVQKVRAEEDPVVAAASILARDAFVQGLVELEEKMGITLPKGAGEKVIQAARKIVLMKDHAFLSEVAKTHFKTMQSL